MGEEARGTLQSIPRAAKGGEEKDRTHDDRGKLIKRLNGAVIGPMGQDRNIAH